MTGWIIFAVVAVGAVLTIRHGARLFFYPSPGRMPGSVGDVEAALVRFEDALRANAPDVLAALRPGLSDEEIRSSERRWRIRLTDDLRALYRWRDGSAADGGVHLIPGHRFVPLAEAAEGRIEQRAQLASTPPVQRLAYEVFAGHRTGWLSVLDDGAGDGYFYDPGRRRHAGSFFYCFAEVREFRFFPSLANFLVGAAECYEAGIYRVGRRGELVEDHDKSPEIWAAYASFFPANS
jgi:cell wall assembly regulator SMI1